MIGTWYISATLCRSNGSCVALVPLLLFCFCCFFFVVFVFVVVGWWLEVGGCCCCCWWWWWCWLLVAVVLLMILLVVLPDENGHWHGSGGSGGGGGARERPLGHKYHAEMKHRVTPVTHIALSGDILTAPPPVSSTNFLYYVPVYPVVSLDPHAYTSLIIVILLSYLVLSRPPPASVRGSYGHTNTAMNQRNTPPPPFLFLAHAHSHYSPRSLSRFLSLSCPLVEP